MAFGRLFHPRRAALCRRATLVCLAVALSSPAQVRAARKAKRRVEPPAGHVALASAPPQTTSLSLPFTGAWVVVQGAKSNGTHTGYAAYALDFVPADARADLAFERRKRLDQHPCFGRAILAPADGVVVWLHADAPDGPPFRESRRHKPGNFIILKHAEAEFTEFRHLQRGSVRVRLGQSVQRGQVIASCGNSGNAVTPHLHFALLGLLDPIATRPMRLSDYQVLGRSGEWHPGDGVPRAGQIVRPASAAAGTSR